ncbi:MAG: hypothetical protein JEZ08_25095, partial [Clostridiales bacterium]|nr:hypothetical protein [Clostridiales bacterium]
YDPASQLIVVLPGGTSSAQSVSISNTIVPGDLKITKLFVGGEDMPQEISVRVTGPEGYDETHDIPIDGTGYGEITLTDLVPGIYEIFELEFDGSDVWTSEIDASPVEVMPGQTDPAALVEITNYRRMVEETAYAYPDGDGGELRNVIKKNSNNWGWYIDASEEILGQSFDVYAAAGQNDISKGKYVGTVTFTDDGSGYYEAEFEADPGIFGLSVTDGPHFGVYALPEDIPNSPGKYSNKVSIADATAIVFHIVVEYPME